MSATAAAVNFLLDNLSQILRYNYHLIADVKDNIEALRNELESLRTLAQYFEKYNGDNNLVKDTVKRIRKIIGDAEDAVDTYLIHAMVQNSRPWICKVFHQITDYPVMLRDVGQQINAITEEIKKIKHENAAISFEALQHQAIININPPAESKEAPKVEEEHVIVGFDEAAHQVEELLTGGAEQLEIYSIVGMVGLGKTTLAKKLFEDPDFDYQFEIRAFVYVSKEYKMNDVFLQILSSFMGSKDDLKEKTAEELKEYLHQQLGEKQYLVVLDDVCEKEDWDNLKHAFPNNNNRSRVLITTRNEKVAEHANDQVKPYILDFLPLEKSIELLRWRVFGKNSCPKEFQPYEIEIAERCDGIPLAIVVIAGIIWNNRYDVNMWRVVAESVRDYISGDKNQTTKVIDLMYKHLPNYLKPCFLYLGVFREDFEIPVWKLVRLWIAEGLIQQRGNSNLEDLAELYLDELVYRNLVTVGQRRSNGKIKTCRMLDTVREFSKNEAAEENIFQEIKKVNSSFDQCRRLCLNNANIVEYLSGGSGPPSGKRVRSFLTFVEEETTVEAKFVTCLPRAYKFLRVLEMQSLNFNLFPANLRNLALLKYIAISSHISSLPSALSDLACMQTLIVNTTSPTVEIKADIWKMPQFRHLHTNASTILPFPTPQNQQTNEEAFASENVQTLSTIAPESCKEEVFVRTPNLKKLGISGTLKDLIMPNGNSSLFNYLRRLEYLENLKLLNDNVSSKLYSLPSKRSFPRQLKRLTLLNTLLDWEEMSTLGKLENLEVLKLKEYAFGGKLWKTKKGGFLSLKHLYIGRMDLVVWEEASADHFPVLMSLELNRCHRLRAVPHGLADISSFQSIVLHRTNTSVAFSARNLEVLKLKHEKKGLKDSSFKLSIYPPEH